MRGLGGLSFSGLKGFLGVWFLETLLAFGRKQVGLDLDDQEIPVEACRKNAT